MSRRRAKDARDDCIGREGQGPRKPSPRNSAAQQPQGLRAAHAQKMSHSSKGWRGTGIRRRPPPTGKTAFPGANGSLRGSVSNFGARRRHMELLLRWHEADFDLGVIKRPADAAHRPRHRGAAGHQATPAARQRVRVAPHWPAARQHRDALEQVPRGAGLSDPPQPSRSPHLGFADTGHRNGSRGPNGGGRPRRRRGPRRLCRS